jgi:hypothetical protein
MKRFPPQLLQPRHHINNFKTYLLKALLAPQKALSSERRIKMYRKEGEQEEKTINILWQGYTTDASV